MTDIIYKEESYNIIGACMRVHTELGAGFLEAVYQEALEKEFQSSKIPFERQTKLSIYYKEEKLKKYYIADFLCFDKIIVELKVAQYLNTAVQAQLKNYLVATNSRLGIVVNFGKKSLEYKRILNPNSH
ncbi:GxxExxY protein [Arenibacter nanhaiticus]|uniref:GxxExxY protein n=1 Tax=Arenibacter nanhaiticus TaxID=558155 RepID=A0A1M6LY33_9FLAO|nr:GxxExxY protein [Arenibacter nanhaiticus]SHJ76099.1 GxxExxY protein [Arenibacter nanhaiticus]